MKRDLPAQALRRAADGVVAVAVLAEHISEIAAACASAPAGCAVIAVVRADLRFDWAWTVPEREVGERMLTLPDGGWAVLFEARASADEVRQGLERSARLAGARYTAMRRYQVEH